MYTEISPDVDYAVLLSFARGKYQRNLLEGIEAWSGSTLRGKARDYGVHYANSRANLLKRIRDAGYTTEYRLTDRKKVLYVGVKQPSIVPVDPRFTCPVAA